MRTRALVAALGVAALAALALRRGPPHHEEARGAGRPAPPRAALAEPSPPVVDPEGLRDVFRFAEESPPAPPGAPARARDEGKLAPRPAPAGPRLVGLVSRAGRLVAALSADGEVVLAGPGETAAGVTVVAVGEDGVRIRHTDGREETLVFP
jgi:hypothetical protein